VKKEHEDKLKHLLSFDTTMTVRPRATYLPVIEGLLHRGDVLDICGRSKVGKSWKALSIVCSVASGIPYNGKNTHKGRVMLIDGHNMSCEILGRRLQLLREYFNAPVDEHVMADCLVGFLRGQRVDYKRMNQLELMHYIEDSKDGEDYSTVVLDQVEEIITPACRRNLGYIAQECNVAIVAVSSSVRELR
jgi:RecA-family ATPase